MKVDASGLDFELSDRQMVKTVQKLARDEIRKACRDSIIANQIEVLEGVPVQTLSQETYKVALLKLTTIATTDTVSLEDARGNKSEVVNPQQLRALEILMEHRIAEGELLLKAQELAQAASGAGAPVSGVVMAQGRAVVVTPRALRKLEEIHRATAQKQE